MAVLRRTWNHVRVLGTPGVAWCGVCIIFAHTFANADPPAVSIEAARRIVLENQDADLALHSTGLDTQRLDAPFIDDSAALHVARIAAARSSRAALLQSEIRLRASRRHTGFADQRNTLGNTLLASIECRERQNASAAALRLHYAIAATIASLELVGRTKDYLRQQEQAQSCLIEQGIPIDDPLLLERAGMQVEDESLVAQSRLQQLRIELSRWVGPELACGYTASPVSPIHPSDSDVCDYVHMATRCRCDLRVLRTLKDDLDTRDLANWDGIAAGLLGVPTAARNTSVPRWTFLTFHSNADAVRDRARWIQRLHQERAQQVTIEVETAFEKKRSAALRWVHSEEVVASWERRIEQLERMNAVHGNFPQQVQANLARLRAQGDTLERWYEWHAANVDLGLATGIDW